MHTPITQVMRSGGCVISFTSVKFLQKRRTKDPESASKCFEEKPVRLKIIKAWFEIYLPKVKAK